MDPKQLLALLARRGSQFGKSAAGFHDSIMSGIIPAQMAHVGYDSLAPKSWPRMPGMPSPDSVEKENLPYYMMGPAMSAMPHVVAIDPSESQYVNEHGRLPTQAEKQYNDQSWEQLQQASQVRLKQLLDVMAAGRKSGMSTKEVESLVRMAKKNSPNSPGDYIRGSGRRLPNGANNVVRNNMNLEQNVPTRTAERIF
jgi:hypothetical protein